MSATLPATSDVTSPEFAGKVAGPCVFVLFGAAGDLTKRKLIPALFNLVKAKLLPDTFAVMGVSVDDLDPDTFRKQVSEFLPTNDPAAVEWLHTRLNYERGDFADPNLFARLRDRLAAIDASYHTEGNYLFYMATAPKFFAPIVQQLGQAGLSAQEDGRWRRVVIEKPFGTDLESAKALNRDIKSVLHEAHVTGAVEHIRVSRSIPRIHGHSATCRQSHARREIPPVRNRS